MFPVLASIGGFAVSSFGVFLLLSFAIGFFVIWRIIRLYDIDPEKIIDLTLMIFLGSIIGARAFFVAIYYPQFNSLLKVIDILRNPGLSFWGGLIGGAIVLVVASRRLKLRVWQVADLITVGFFIAWSIGSIGCFLGSCEYGVESNLFFAVSQSGVIGQRFPIQIIQSLMALVAFWYIWKSIIKFHFDGQIVGIGLILLGVIKLLTEPLKVSQVKIFDISITYFFSLVLIVSGIWVLYSKSKKSLRQDLTNSVNIIAQENKRKQALSKARRWWYNIYVNARLSIVRFKKALFKLLHVKSNPDQF
jgi:phosphatidylglycerol:prolipoprotein diacylglycerol transferase